MYINIYIYIYIYIYICICINIDRQFDIDIDIYSKQQSSGICNVPLSKKKNKVDNWHNNTN